MFLDKLQSGYLLFQTRQGLVRVELSLKQRIYLLWTFRNFRQLSVPLLNSRQRALVNALFRNNAGVVSHLHSRTLAIGVVEDFVPPPVAIGASPAQIPVQIKARKEKVVALPARIAPKPDPVPSSSRRFAWSKLATSMLATFKLATSKLALATSKLATFKLATFKLATSKLARPKLTTAKLATPRLATTGGVLCLCIVSVIAWHRIEGIPSSQAHNQPRVQPINMTVPPDSPHVAKPAAAIAESPTAIAPPAAVQPLAAPKAAVVPASIDTVIPTSIPTPKRVIRVQDAASAPNLPLSGQDSGIQASRAPLHFAYPDYPDARTRGVVALIARVDSAGAVRTVRVVSGKRALAAAAVRAVRQWRYRPYVKDGQSVATETNIVISFIAEDAISMTFPPSIPATR